MEEFRAFLITVGIVVGIVFLIGGQTLLWEGYTLRYGKKTGQTIKIKLPPSLYTYYGSGGVVVGILILFVILRFA
jgi:hypothetical protein